VHSDLKALLDLMTPLYKARMEHLAEQPRKLLAHLMEHWAPIGAGDLARASGIPPTTVSGQLTRLEAEGLVEKTRLAGTSRSGYQVSERFFNVWYLMRYTPRRVRQRLTWLVEFMRLWFSADDLQSLARRNMASLRSGGQRAEQLEIEVLLQAQLWLKNQDAASLALDRLANTASKGNSHALFKIQEQAREYHTIGLGPPLADLMDASDYADLLRPIALALRAAHSGNRAFDDIPAEIQGMAEESLADIQRRG